MGGGRRVGGGGGGGGEGAGVRATVQTATSTYTACLLSTHSPTSPRSRRTNIPYRTMSRRATYLNVTMIPIVTSAINLT